MTLKNLILAATLSAALFAQTPPTDPKPADLTPAEKLAAFESVTKLRGFEIAKRQLTEAAEKDVRDYRDKVLQQLNDAIAKLKADADTEAAALDKQMETKKAKGWRLNPDKGMTWEPIPEAKK